MPTPTRTRTAGSPHCATSGVIPAGVRFQVQYPTPLASIGAYVVPEQQQTLLPSYERAMFANLDRRLAAIPNDQVAVQWDVAVEFGVLENAFRARRRSAFDAIVAALARCVDQVPGDIPVGMHLCYGDYDHAHFTQPESLALQARVMNAVTAAAHRTISFVSFTVPQDQRDEGYFAPLAELAADPATELNFALVPPPRTTRRPALPGRARPGFIDAALAAGPARAGLGHLHRVRHGPAWRGKMFLCCWSCTGRSSPG